MKKKPLILFNTKSLPPGSLKPVKGSTGSKIHELYTAWRATGAKSAAQELHALLFSECQKLVRIRQKMYMPPHPALREEMEGAALTALAQGLASYDPTRGARLWTYLPPLIHRAISNALKRDWDEASVPKYIWEARGDLRARPRKTEEELEELHSKEALAEARALLEEPIRGLRLGKVMMDRALPVDGLSPEDIVAQKELAAAGRAALAQLPEREARMLDMHYIQEMKFEAIGKVFGVKRSRSGQIHESAVERLREGIAARLSPAPWIKL
jgi:RNA polymerase sigma factor for flagellar operon FliA